MAEHGTGVGFKLGGLAGANEGSWVEAPVAQM